MFVVGDGQRLAVVMLIDKVTHQEGGAALLQGTGHVFQHHVDVGAGPFGLEVEQFADNEEDVLAALLGRDKLLHFVAEEDDTHLVVVLDGREGYGGTDFGHHLALGNAHSTKILAAAHVHEKHHREFAFLLIDLDIGAVVARGDIPVDVAHVITVLVLAHLAESHTPALESRVVLAGEYVLRQALCLDFYLADLAQQLISIHFLCLFEIYSNYSGYSIYMLSEAKAL